MESKPRVFLFFCLFVFFLLLIFFSKYAFSCQNHIEEVGSDEGNLWLRSLREQQNHFIITSFACTDVWVPGLGALQRSPPPSSCPVAEPAQPGDGDTTSSPRYSHPDFFYLAC